MQIILAEYQYKAHVIGVTADEAGVVPYIVEFLGQIQLGAEVPHTMRVTEYDSKAQYLKRVEEIVYPVLRESISDARLLTPKGEIQCLGH